VSLRFPGEVSLFEQHFARVKENDPDRIE
jgi:hypothetical protein